LQAGDYENSNGGKRRVSRLTQFIHATLQLLEGWGWTIPVLVPTLTVHLSQCIHPRGWREPPC